MRKLRKLVFKNFFCENPNKTSLVIFGNNLITVMHKILSKVGEIEAEIIVFWKLIKNIQNHLLTMFLSTKVLCKTDTNLLHLIVVHNKLIKLEIKAILSAQMTDFVRLKIKQNTLSSKLIKVFTYFCWGDYSWRVNYSYHLVGRYFLLLWYLNIFDTCLPLNLILN